MADHDATRFGLGPNKNIFQPQVGFLADLDLPGRSGRHTNGNVHLTPIQLFRGTDSTLENELNCGISVSYCQSSLTRSGIAVKGGRPWVYSGNVGMTSS